MDPDVNAPWLATNVPPRDACAATGVSAVFAWLRPHNTITLPVLPVIADLFAAGHALPAACVVVATTASVISQVCTVMPSPGPSAPAVESRLGLSKPFDFETTTFQVPLRSDVP